MGLLTNRVGRNEIKPGDHIYTYRAVFAYSHHESDTGATSKVESVQLSSRKSSCEISVNILTFAKGT
ncbi:hypothetical protein KY290_025429 [Solanum tuberosum]|uniref:Uncharacterized protein n=1 Tax=Solanum tuberosum TaxID=4113 RepID=A0ABQ7UTJ1_SOLTU|nr:hypothetical protein KY289_024506 [Solanum tuberosum]KAH0755159.1 hypothetical protein KY290_025429 [Solanum tuberosum]